VTCRRFLIVSGHRPATRRPAGRTHRGGLGRRAGADVAHVKSGKLRPVAVGTLARLPLLPDVPTVAAQGYPGFETSQWYGLQAPAGTPDAIVRRLADEAGKALRASSVTERFASEVVRRAGIKPD
jgi:tripartite-type tricarboxylate transporter receptor subunit TctC